MPAEEINVSKKYHRKTPVRTFDLNKTLYDTVLEQNRNNMDSEAIGFLGYSMTFKELFKNVDKLADAYYRFGLREGDTVAICTINMPLVQENLLALSKIGVTSKWVDLRVKQKELLKNFNESNCKIVVAFDGIVSQIKEIIDETSIEKVLVASPKDYLNAIVHVLADLKDKKENKYVSIPDDSRFISYKKFLNSGNENSSLKSIGFKQDRRSIIVQSSGSTGVAKSIVHTEYNFNSEMQKEAYNDLPFADGKSLYVAIPPFIIYGLNNSIYLALVFSLKAEMTPFVSETTLFDDLGKYDFAAVAPLHCRYLYNKINELKESGNEKAYLNTLEKLSRVKCFISGGDKITVEEILDMQHTFSVPILNGYGNNELTGGAIMSPLYASKPDSVGVPFNGVEVFAFDVETGRQLKRFEEGEICIHSDSVFVEYLNNPEETSRVKQKHADGKYWIHTGDLGYIDNDGFVYITGRAKRLIKREAFKISPDTIENAIMLLEEVKDCVVVGVTDLEYENSFVPMAFVELYPEFVNRFKEIEPKILECCNKELPDYEIPKYIKFIDKIPYKNTKHNFKELEKLGEEYVESLSKKGL